MGARFSLLGFLLSASVLIWIRSSQVRRFFYPVVALIVGALVYYVGYFYFLSQEVIRENRFVRLVYASGDRKSTRLNSSHVRISYAVFCLKKKKKKKNNKKSKNIQKKQTNITIKKYNK